MSLDRYLKHLKLYGSDGMMDAAKNDLTRDQLVALQLEVDAVTVPKPRTRAEDRVDRLLGIEPPVSNAVTA